MKSNKPKKNTAKKAVAVVKKSAVKSPSPKKAVKAEKPVAKTAAASKTKTPAPVPAKNTAMAKPVAPVAAPKKSKLSKAELKAASKKVPEAAVTGEAPIKRPAKLFFIEVKPGSERVIKRGDKSLASPTPMDIQARRKDTATEETSEELVERIERELQHQSFFKHNALKPQMCTKCGINVVAERFTIDRELGYCLDCADILRLGATKEARRMEFNPVAKKEEPGAPAEEAGEIIEPPAEGDEEALPDID